MVVVAMRERIDDQLYQDLDRESLNQGGFKRW